MNGGLQRANVGAGTEKVKNKGTGKAVTAWQEKCHRQRYGVGESLEARKPSRGVLKRRCWKGGGLDLTQCWWGWRGDAKF